MEGMAGLNVSQFVRNPSRFHIFHNTDIRGVHVRQPEGSESSRLEKRFFPPEAELFDITTGGGSGKSGLPAQPRHIAFIVGWVRKLEIEAMR
ncbi:hypothetical protein ACO22_06312 [Paracoccidioides brasiliensis]|uniref:Uncharacterized protein n=1 Tax=Paracoccidioides brasiliensis TaxID=121759 RepID=A0A1D2J7T9_PARBR|nr:hypothetical protein ACO22_06312 [Paracoccidioides brasiliensis]ODH47269.1 hypothetical protein GX48_06609 [Paracoccidioides brasiliensis]